MKLLIKRCKKMVALLIAVALTIGSMPLMELRAADETTGTVKLSYDGTELGSESKLIFTGDEFASAASKVVTAEITDSASNEVNLEDCSVEWKLENDTIVTVDDATGEITPVGMGETTVTVTYTYMVVEEGAGTTEEETDDSAGESTSIEETASATFDVVVYSKPALNINVKPSTNIEYPNAVEITVSGSPEGVTPTLTFFEKGTEEVVDTVEGDFYEGSLKVGEYTVEASTSAFEYYEATTATADFTVTSGKAGVTVVASDTDTEVYYTDDVTYTLTSTVPGTFSIGTGDFENITKNDANEVVDTIAVGGENLTAKFTVDCNQTGIVEVSFSFEPEDNSYAIPIIANQEIIVKKIPVKIAWDTLEKTYDGEKNFITPAQPKIYLDGVEGYDIAGLTIKDAPKEYVFELDDDIPGEYTIYYPNEFELNNDNYEFKTTEKGEREPIIVNIEILGILLDAESDININEIVATSKQYDGSSDAEFSVAPMLVSSKKITEEEIANLKLEYVATYYDNNDKEVVGTPNGDVEAAKVVISNLKVLCVSEDGSTSATQYFFPIGYTKTIEGKYNILANAGFEAFTGITLTDLGAQKDNDATYWFNEEVKIQTPEDSENKYLFKQSMSNGWTASIDVTSIREGKKVELFAKLDVKKKNAPISGGVTIGYDKTPAQGSIYVSVYESETDSKAERELISVDKLADYYSTIESKKKIAVTIDYEDSGSGVKEILWCGSDIALKDNNEIEDAIVAANEAAVDLTKNELDFIKSEKEIKRFYYAKITDYAGNVSYVYSTGVLQDITPPKVSSVSLADTSDTYSKKNVYSSNTVGFTVDLQETGITSGLVDVIVELVPVIWDDEGGSSEGAASEYSINDDIWKSVEGSNTLKDIRDHAKIEAPTADQIDKVSTGNDSVMTLEGEFKNLEDGHYKVYVKAVDKAGNPSLVVDKEFIVDTKDPDVKINIDSLNKNKDVMEDENYPDGIYTDGFVKITVSDMTLTTSLTDLLSGIEGELWDETYATNGTKTYEATVNFGDNATLKDGVYTLLLSAKDSVGRTNEMSKTFCIDGTAPTYTVEFTARNENSTIIEKEGVTTYYYNSDIVATFTINETGTFAEDVIAISVKNAQGDVVIQWPQEEDESAEQTADTTVNPYQLEHEANSNIYKLTILADGTTDDDGYTFEISGQDKAGNDLKLEVTSEISKIPNNDITIVRAMDTVAPVLTNVEYKQGSNDAVFNTVDGKDYTNEKTKMIFTLKEHNPLASVTSITSEEAKKEEGADATVKEWGKTENVDEYQLSLDVPMYGEEGDEQTITVEIKDLAGNLATMSVAKRSENNTFEANEENGVGIFSDKFTVDTVKPHIKYEYVEYNPVTTVETTIEEDTNNSNEPNAVIEKVDYFNNEIKVQVTIEEHNFNASELTESVTMLGLDENGKQVEYVATDWEQDEENKDKYVKTFTFTEDNQYNIKIGGTDCAMNEFNLLNTEEDKISVQGVSEEVDENTSIYYTALNVAVDKTMPTVGDNTKPVVVITPATPVNVTLKDDVYGEQALYRGDVTYEVVVYDPATNNFCSGINDIEFNIKAENGKTAKSTVSKEGTITNSDGLTVSLVNENKAEVLANLAKGKVNQYVFEVAIDSEAFNSNEIVLSVVTKDVSTNGGGAEAAAIAIDTIAPQLTLSYNNNDVSNDRFFHEERIATIEVVERNFSNDCVELTVNGERVDIAFSLIEEGTGNRDNAVWRAHYTFSSDDDYSVSLSCRDRAGNTGGVTYTGEAPTDFTVDRTEPTIAVSFSSNRTLDYYDAARTATIQIVEHNFNSGDVQIIGTALDDGTAITYPSISSWSSVGDTHTATITYSSDALYTLDVAYSDLATNTAVQPGVRTFTIDNVDPTITISGVEDGKAYAGEVLPQIRFSDKNYDAYEIILTRTERDKFGIDVTSKFVGDSRISISGTGHGIGSNDIADIEHIAENDGIYELTVIVYDKAGRSTEESVVYSVNRFGSVYVYSQALTALISGYHQNVEGDLYIMAYNADALIEDSTKLEITCDGSVVSGQKSNANVNDSLVSNEGWHEYRFDLNPADFAKDGSYIITLSDMDEAGNTRTNSDAPIQFFIDTTAPVLDSVIGLEESIINAEEKVINYVISDAISLANVQIFVDDKLIATVEEFDSNTYEGSFTLGAGMYQEIRMVATDKAGNVLDTAEEAFQPAFAYNSVVTVSTNIFVRWYANTALFWGSIAGGVGLVALSFIIILLKRRKDDEEAAEE